MLRPVTLMYGCDPEGFFKRDGKIIGAERVLPEEGLGVVGHPVVNLDGVQYELNPFPGISVHQLGNNLNYCFTKLKQQMLDYPYVQFCWDTLVEVERGELEALSPKARELNCEPSKNIYGEKPITVNGTSYRKRSAGGHMHFGLHDTAIYDGISNDERGRLIPLFDVFVGNSGVLLDRAPGQAERRENYGRAGEYRPKPYGVEYRTPSNFWLRNYSIMDFMYGMANIAVSVLDSTIKGIEDLEGELIETVDINKVIEAIDNNDYELARKNFQAITPFLKKHLPARSTKIFPFTPGVIDKFLMFTDWVDQEHEHLGVFFPINRVDHWATGAFTSFEDFLSGVDLIGY
jgi:hypothetical protein